MIYTPIFKGQQQSAFYNDNICFLPEAIGDLLLDYVGLHCTRAANFSFRQRAPRTLISPSLCVTLDGTGPDGTLSTCLCASAMVRWLHVSNWRQISVSICKKFSAQERVHFELENVDVEDELEIWWPWRNKAPHSHATFNQACASSTTLTMNALLHRNYRASASWRGLFSLTVSCKGKGLAMRCQGVRQRGETGRRQQSRASTRSI